MKKSRRSTRPVEGPLQYEGPRWFIWGFYLFMVLWTGVCAYLIGARFLESSWPLWQVVMVAFVVAYSWYFSLGISWRIQMGTQGSLQFKSFLSIIDETVEGLKMVEAPRLAIVPFGFLRFHLKDRKVYQFCLITDSGLKGLLIQMGKKNPEIRFKGIG